MLAALYGILPCVIEAPTPPPLSIEGFAANRQAFYGKLSEMYDAENMPREATLFADIAAGFGKSLEELRQLQDPASTSETL